MKKRFTLSTILVLWIFSVFAAPIDRAEARRVAEELVSINDNASDDVAWAPYYVFSRGAGKGFVIVSGDDETAPVIGYTEDGDFDENDIPEPLKDMLDAWAEKIKKLQTIDRPKVVKRSAKVRLAQARRGVEAFKAKWQDIPEMLQTRWSQGSPYNDLCPVKDGHRAVTGCVATAASQIVYYFHKDNPDTLIYNTPTYADNWGDSYGNYPVTESLPAGTKVEYSLMKMSGHGTAAQDHAVAVLMYAVGTSSRLNYGPSTAGQPDEAGRALASQFNLLSDYHGKWNYSQQGWEELIYSSLKKGSPMLYGGTHPTNGGHAVVIDGYQASTGLYHFNFGWGGGGTSSGSGWYTVDDETGMNGFNSDQRGCLNFRPRKQNLEASIERPILYNKVDCPITIKVKNNGTLSYSGMKVYCGTTKTRPTTVTYEEKVKSVPSGKEGEFTFTYKPTSARLTYIYLCDANDNLLDTIAVPVVQSVADFKLNGLSVDGSGVQKTVDDYTFEVVNSLVAHVAANITNGDEGTICQPALTCRLDSYDESTKTWKGVKTVSHNDSVYQVKETKDFVFTVSDLIQNTLYRATIIATAKAGKSSTIAMDEDNKYVYFTVKESNLVFEASDRHVTVTGSWNKALFEEQGYGKEICSIDLREVEDMQELPKLPNKNVIYYLKKKLADNIPNVVVDGICDSLVISTSSEFKASLPFTATKAVLLLEDAEPGKWCSTVVPFAAEMSKGIFANKITKASTTVVTTEMTRAVDAMTPIIYMSDCKLHNKIEAVNAAISSVTNVTDESVGVSSSTLSSTFTGDYKLLQEVSDAPYFVTASEEEIPPFCVILASSSANNLRACTPAELNVFPRLKVLAQTIDYAFDVLAEKKDERTPAAVEAFQTVIDEAEEAFVSRALTLTKVNNQITDLENAINEFLNQAPTGIEFIDIESTIVSGTSDEYYMVNGVKLDAPVKGIVIIKNGSKVRKMIVK